MGGRGEAQESAQGAGRGGQAGAAAGRGEGGWRGLRLGGEGGGVPEVLVVGDDAVADLDDLAAALLEGLLQQQRLQRGIQRLACSGRKGGRSSSHGAHVMCVH
jgi:hypothetical protein